MLVYEPRSYNLQGAAVVLPQPLTALAGKTIGFVDNSKPNFNHLVDDLSAIFVDRYGAAAVRKYRKRGPNIPVSDAVMRELENEVDLVITGSAE